MHADPTELGCSSSLQSTLCVPSLNAGPGKQLLWRGSLTAPTRAGWGPLSLIPHSQACSQRKQCELQKQVPAAFP